MHAVVIHHSRAPTHEPCWQGSSYTFITSLHTLVGFKSLLSSPTTYRLLHPVLSLAAKLNEHMVIQHNYRHMKEFDSFSEQTAQAVSPQAVVLDGPFKGVRYPSLQATGSSLLPKILGVYESELHDSIHSLVGPYELILDIGCAEGYFAVGLAMMHPQATIHAYDIDEAAARMTRDMARLNGVSDRLIVHGGASWKDLDLCTGKRSLVVSDCEGYERLLFCGQNISSLSTSDLIIELHPAVWDDVTDFLLTLFSQTHDCTLVTSVPDDEKNTDLEPIRHLPLEQRKLCVAEFRGNFQQWLICKSRLQQK